MVSRPLDAHLRAVAVKRPNRGRCKRTTRVESAIGSGMRGGATGFQQRGQWPLAPTWAGL
jgi:hypothetical protein